MTALLKQAFAQAEKLPAWEQDALAAFIMEEIAASYQWNKISSPSKKGSIRQSSRTRIVQQAN